MLTNHNKEETMDFQYFVAGITTLWITKRIKIRSELHRTCNKQRHKNNDLLLRAQVPIKIQGDT